MQANAIEEDKLDISQESKIVPNGLIKPLTLCAEKFKNTVEIDFSNRDLEEIGENVAFSPCLRRLNLSNNKLREVPKVVLDLKDLEVLDVSHNQIEYFNDTPGFCHAIEHLNISNNELRSPPIWIWLESAKNLSKLDISCNVHIADLFQEYIDELLRYETVVTHVTLYNCKLGKYLNFLSTFKNAKEVVLGTQDWSCYAANHVQELPSRGLDKCCYIQRLILPNTYIYTISPQIKMYTNLIEINLSHNNLNGLPTEFCELENLEICTLSFNNILYVPDKIVNLKKLTILSLAVNELCMIPENMTNLVNLRILDLYDNHISELPGDIKSIPEIDLAQNYCEEPDDSDYLEKRAKLRLQHPDRLSGRKLEIEKESPGHSPDTTDDEESMASMTRNENNEPTNNPPSSPEDWDSDSYWEPTSAQYNRPRPNARWMVFLKKAMDNGNLCPYDNHAVSVMEMVQYEKKCYPREEYESDGQFDDFSDDDS